MLISARTGEVIRNLTEPFDQDLGFQYISMLGLRFNTVPWLSWAPDGDRIAYFVRKNKYKSLVIQNVVTRDIEQIIDLDMVDEPESPDFSPDGRSVVFSARNRARRRHLPHRPRHARGHQPDRGRSGRLRADLCAGRQQHPAPEAHQRQQQAVPAGPRHGRADAGDVRHARRGRRAVHRRAHDRVSRRRRSNPGSPIDPEVARDGEIFNVWTLDLENGELNQLHGHRHRQRQPGPHRARRGRRAPTGSPSSPTTRASTACTRWNARSRCSRPSPATSAPEAGRSSTSRRR